ncbi:serine protease Do [Microbacteriaceae bacterium SG_E_30_P1]|uniref:Serine protease Do n=1 Tax=Antiquaquibacter oligotrophicus TaxID=2880260 RepID=A0ABT6KLJ5_9MICO|nr:S1C family serine protease [Antiquaquibacter oligotrophicus]MDH6179982.1 serine protease Do [Antiquaquibacter oligotrophicus]UDF14262.1 S1C family serine protease [Antiquaquibacter oligotrophicus]
MSVPSSVRNREARVARGALVASALASTFALSACFGGAPTPVATESGVGFDDVQSATIQLEAVGTFVDPSYGGYEGAGRGSGFLISPDGLAITNNHVVVGAGTLEVWRGGDQSKTLNAQVLGSSECLDIAVVQLPAGTYPYLDWHEGEIPAATEVYSAGFPLGDPNFTLTKGIVSKSVSEGETSWASVDTVIEHDARIRPGNSGGPLVDADGRVVGVNYAGESQFDYNYAIHRDEVLAVLDQLIEGEDVLSLGINAQGVTDDEGNGLGIWVSSVAAGSAADKAGVKPGDLVTRMQGVSMGVNGTLAEYCDVLRTHGQDAALDIELYRPDEGLYYRGQVNSGDTVEAVTVLGGGGTDGVYQWIQDDTASIAVEVPASWSQIDGAPYTDGAGNAWSSVEASSDLNGYRTTWGTPGVSIVASADAVGDFTTQQLMDQSTAGLADAGCSQIDSDEYDDGFHQGIYTYWTGCGGGASYVVVTANATAGNYVVAVAVQAISDSDLDAIDRVLGSFYAEF